MFPATSVGCDAAKLAICCADELDLQAATLGPEYFYQSLPLCVIDAVYSIGVRYQGVQNIVRRYCEYFGLQEFRAPIEQIPQPSQQQSLSVFLENFASLGIPKLTLDVFRNRQRTSSRNGILKSEAVFHFAKVCHESGMDFLQDVGPKVLDTPLEMKLRKIPGQGISVGYFFMLAGNDDLIKPDRWILNFLTRCLGRSPGLAEAQSLFSAVCSILRKQHPSLSPRLLDNTIWKYERSRV
jgi:hypothetical protein